MKHAHRNFAIMTAVSGLAMFLAMYLMIDTLADFRFNLNTLYMTAAMLAQWLVGMILMFVSGALFGGAAVAAASISQPAGQISIGLGGLFIWVMAMTGCYRWIRNQAVKLASC